jgi:hypothetical protein
MRRGRVIICKWGRLNCGYGMKGLAENWLLGGLTSHEVNPGSEIDRVAVGDVRDSTPGQGSDALGLVGPMGGEFGVG